MIRFQRKETEKSKAAVQSLTRERQKKKGTYNTPEVNAALQEMFLGKCYLCESKDVTAYEIEHLISAGQEQELRYEWNNLFLACAHCNSTKKKRHEPILDCTQVDVDHRIRFFKEGYWGTAEVFQFQALDNSTETLHTTALLEEIYYGRTPQKKLESAELRKNCGKNCCSLRRMSEIIRKQRVRISRIYIC